MSMLNVQLTMFITNQYVESDRLFCSCVMLTSILTKRIKNYFQSHTISRQHQADIRRDISAQKQGLYQATQVCIIAQTCVA